MIINMMIYLLNMVISQFATLFFSTGFSEIFLGDILPVINSTDLRTKVAEKLKRFAMMACTLALPTMSGGFGTKSKSSSKDDRTRRDQR